MATFPALSFAYADVLRQLTLCPAYADLKNIGFFHLGCAILRQTYALLTANQLDCNQLVPNLTPTLRHLTPTMKT